MTNRQRDTGSDRVPLPDPTILTTEALHREVATIMESIDTAFAASNVLTEQKFREINRRFDDVERHRVEQKQDTKTAVDAALAAQKESNAKSEADVTRKLNEIVSSVTSPIADIKERLTRIESLKQGGSDMRASIIAFGGIIVAVAAYLAGKG